MNIDLIPTHFYILASLIDTDEDNVFIPYCHQDHVIVSGTSIYVVDYVNSVEKLSEKGLIGKVANSNSIFISELGREYLQDIFSPNQKKNQNKIEQTVEEHLELYGTAILVDGELIDQTRVVIHKRSGESIYPQFKRFGECEISEGGLSKLDYFAGKALGIIDIEFVEHFGCSDTASQVYDLAQAMAKESNNRQS